MSLFSLLKNYRDGLDARCYESCMCFIYDFCSYIRRENPTCIHIRLEKDFAVNHSLERFL